MWRESWILFYYGKINDKMYYTIKTYDLTNNLCIIRINHCNVLFNNVYMNFIYSL